MEKEIKIRYSKEEIEVLRDKAKRMNKSIKEYQKIISKKAKVKIETND